MTVTDLTPEPVDLSSRARARQGRVAPRRAPEPADRAAGDGRLGQEAPPPHEVRNPVMFVVFIGSLLTTYLFVRDLPTASAADSVFTGSRRDLAVVHGAVRELRRGRGRRPGQGAGRHAPQDPLGDAWPTCCSTTDRPSSGSRPELHVGDRVVVDRRRAHPGRRRRDRGHRVGRRVGDHRRVGAGDPRIGRRPLGGHRRHARALRPHRREDPRPSPARASSTA